MGQTSDIHYLTRVLLARLPSETALEHPERLSTESAIGHILLGEEFLRTILTPMREDNMAHDTHGLRLGDDDRLWVRNHVPLTARSRSRIMAAAGWRELFGVLLTDTHLNETLLRLAGATDKYERFASLAEVAKLSPTKPAAPVSLPMPMPACGYSAEQGQALLDAIRGGLDYGETRTRLYGLFESGVDELLWLYFQLPVQTGIPEATDYLIRVMAAHTYARFGMYVTGYALTADLFADEANLQALRADDRARLLKQHVQNALWSGRPAEAIDFYRRLCVLYPLDWEYHYLLGDNILHSDPEIALNCFRRALAFGARVPASARIAMAGALGRQGAAEEAMSLLLKSLDACDGDLDAWLGLANLAHQAGDLWAWRQHLARYFELQGLSAADIRAEAPDRMFAIGEVMTDKREDHPLISVIMTSYNAERTLRQAVDSVRNQTLAHIEIIIVDDVSDDSTRDLILALAAEDGRIRHTFNDRNMGTYMSRNRGIAQARGEFITFLDSDDWMHPQRLERHLAVMKINGVASMSGMIRMTWDGVILPRKGGAYQHRNASSLFVRRQVFDEIGVFDSIRAGADSEFLWRIRNHYGLHALLDVKEVLALVLSHETSLTTSGAAAWDVFRFSPVRLDYSENFGAWQIDRLLAGAPLYVPAVQKKRLFPAPAALRP